jgi:hypothetical protein
MSEFNADVKKILTQNEIEANIIETEQLAVGTTMGFYFGGLLILGSISKAILMGLSVYFFPIFGLLNLLETTLKYLDAKNSCEQKAFKWFDAVAAVFQSAAIIVATIASLAFTGAVIAALAPWLFIGANALGALISIGKMLFHAYKSWRAADPETKADYKALAWHHARGSVMGLTATAAVASLMLIPGAIPIGTAISAVILIGFSIYFACKLIAKTSWWKSRSNDAPALPAPATNGTALEAPRAGLFSTQVTEKTKEIKQKIALKIKALEKTPSYSQDQTAIDKTTFLNKLLTYIDYFTNSAGINSHEHSRISTLLIKKSHNLGEVFNTELLDTPKARDSFLAQSEVKRLFDEAKNLLVLLQQQQKQQAEASSDRNENVPHTPACAH